MRRQPNEDGEVGWSGRISSADLKELRELLDMTGAVPWSVTRSLEAFLNLMEASPALRAWAHDDIERAMQEGNHGRLTEFSLSIPQRQYDRFNNLFPEFGATVWFLRRAIKGMIRELQAEPIQQKVDRAVSLYFRPGSQ